MSALTRKQLLLSKDNISRLHEWSDRYHLSEAELVRRAIQDYDPEHELAQPALAEHQREVEVMLEHMEKALRSAMEAVDTANDQVRQVLAEMHDPKQRTAITEDVQQELAETPGWLDEVADLMTDQREGVV